MCCMKTREEALAYGLSFPDTYQEAPFHDENWQLVSVSLDLRKEWVYQSECKSSSRVERVLAECLFVCYSRLASE